MGSAMLAEGPTDLQHSTLRKIRNRCVLPLLLAFVISYLDRVNVGFAALTANRDLGLTRVEYGWGAGLLFLGYCFFELPSNLALERFGARRWIARIMVTWGVIGCGMALVTRPAGFYLLRFLLFLTDRPDQARWLTDAERGWLRAEFAREAPDPVEASHGFTWRMLGDGRVLALAAVFFLTGMPSYGLSLWLPQIVHGFGVTHLSTGFLTAMPFFVGCVAMLYWGHRSDRRQERSWHAVSAAVLAGFSLLAGALASSPAVQLGAVCLAAAGTYGMKGPFLSIVSEAFAGGTAAAGIALVSTLGNLSGFAAPAMVGVIIGATDSYRLALMALGLESALGGLLLCAWPIVRGAKLRARMV
jgi:MFS family permease